jgi:hypothetical protein
MSLINPSTTRVTAELVGHLNVPADERKVREEDKAAPKSAREQKERDQAVADENFWLSKVADSNIVLDKLLMPELVMWRHRYVLQISTGAKKAI